MEEAVSVESRKRSMANAVQKEVVAGFHVESQTDTNAVLVKGKPTNHVLHLILTLVTFGLWSIVWIIMAVANKETRVMLQVDEYGQILRQQV
ncbi:membrane protein [Streptomyces phage TagePhighter]|nr:membrane protein [Streptomyces phage TagePhighter]